MGQPKHLCLPSVCSVSAGPVVNVAVLRRLRSLVGALVALKGMVFGSSGGRIS